MDERVLIILSKHDFCYQAIKDEGYNIDCPYRGNRMPIRLLREIFFSLRLPGSTLWYNKRVNKNMQSIVVYNALITREYMYWLRKCNPKSQIIYLYTDPVEKAISPELLPDNICEKWSSDYLDCKKYGLKMGLPGGYFNSWKMKKEKTEWDIFFIGRDKKRLDKLLAIKKEFEKIGLTTNFYITAYHRYQKYNNPIYKPLIPYKDVLKLIGKSRAILHLVEGGYKGMSIRIMESIIHEVKLITDNSYIRNMDIYRPNNIFILGEDQIENLPRFLDTPFEPYDIEFVKSLYYKNYIDYMVNVNKKEKDK